MDSYELERRHPRIPIVEQNGGASTAVKIFSESMYIISILFADFVFFLSFTYVLSLEPCFADAPSARPSFAQYFYHSVQIE